METRSLEQLEKDIWKEPSEFPSDLVEKCHRYRKISIAELTNEQIRLLISQQIGMEHLIGTVLARLQLNVLSEGDYYEGDLLVATSKLPIEFWKENQTAYRTFKGIVDKNSELIKAQLGEKEFNKLINKIV